MKGRIALVVGAATGYVLGARAGTERYEQIKQQAPKLQAMASQAAAKATAGVKRQTKHDASSGLSRVNGTPDSAPVPPAVPTPSGGTDD